MEDILHKIWQKLSYKYMSKAKSLKLWKKISNKYNKRKRHYHNLNHIYDMIQIYYFSYIDKLENPDEILFAIFYHDIIYNVRHSDNELHSGVYMDGCLKGGTRLNEKQLGFIFDCITATKTHEKNHSNDINYMLDFDMAILGQSWSEYSDYRKKIRKEYNIYPNFMYNKGRLDVLKKFLEQEKIFKTEEFHKLYEKQARENIQKEIDFYEQIT